MFWSMFRTASDRYRAYCEPFHEHLLSIVDDKDLVDEDPTHTGINDVFAEYRSLDRDALGNVWRPWYGRERFLLKRGDEADGMEAYLRFLIDSSPQRSVMKFTRATFRVEWFREKFPGATIVRLVRRPRDVWRSMWGRDWGVGGEPFGSFIRYSKSMAEDIGLDLPGDPYRTFYALMILGDEMSEKMVDDSWAYEEAVSDFTSWSTRHLIETGLMEAIPPIPVRTDSIGAQIHEGSWFDDQEEAVRSLVGNSVKSFLLDRDREPRTS
jgi:hypothetical protein